MKTTTTETKTAMRRVWVRFQDVKIGESFTAFGQKGSEASGVKTEVTGQWRRDVNGNVLECPSNCRMTNSFGSYSGWAGPDDRVICVRPRPVRA